MYVCECVSVRIKRRITASTTSRYFCEVYKTPLVRLSLVATDSIPSSESPPRYGDGKMMPKTLSAEFEGKVKRGKKKKKADSSQQLYSCLGGRWG